MGMMPPTTIPILNTTMLCNHNPASAANAPAITQTKITFSADTYFILSPPLLLYGRT